MSMLCDHVFHNTTGTKVLLENQKIYSTHNLYGRIVK